MCNRELLELAEKFLETWDAENDFYNQESLGSKVSQRDYFDASVATHVAANEFRAALAAQPVGMPQSGLTVEQVWKSDEIMAANGEHAGLPTHKLMPLVRAIERAHGIGEPHA